MKYFTSRVQFIQFVTARVAKRVKVIFSQASVCPTRGGEVGNYGPGHNTSLPPPGHRSQHLPPPRAQVTTPPSPPGHRSLHLPPPRAQVTTPPPPAQVTTPPSPQAQVTTPPDYTQAGGTHPTGMHSC